MNKHERILANIIRIQEDKKRKLKDKLKKKAKKKLVKYVFSSVIGIPLIFTILL